MTTALARPPARFFLLAAVLLGLLNIACPGSLPDDPIGGGGTGGSSGGTMGTGGAPCEAFMTILMGQRCAASGCHAATMTQGVDLQSPGVVARLLNVKSTSATCGTVSKPYLVPDSNPATGLFIDKLIASPPPPCGVVMPYVGFGGELNPDEIACLQSWATAVTTHRITSQ